MTLGPLNNLAIALNVEPALPGLLKSVVVMGGALPFPATQRRPRSSMSLSIPKLRSRSYGAVSESHRGLGST